MSQAGEPKGGEPLFEPVFEPTPGAPDVYQPTAPPGLVDAAKEYIAAATWIYAKTMPKLPHQYVVRERARAAGLYDGHEALHELIRDHHLDKFWGRRSWRTVDLDGFSYWILETGQIINRRAVAEAQRRTPRVYPRPLI